MMGYYHIICFIALLFQCALVVVRVHSFSSKSPSTSRPAFGDKVKISILLPSRNEQEVDSFLKNDVSRIVKTSWRGKKFESLGNDQWKLYLPVPLPPGLGTIEPSMTVEFKYRENSKGIYMTSLSKEIIGKGGIIMDKKFIESFDLKFSGFIEPEKSKRDNKFYYIGEVEYEVYGEVPFSLKIAPPGVLKGVIELIKRTIRAYAINEITSNIQKEFRVYLSSTSSV